MLAAIESSTLTTESSLSHQHLLVTQWECLDQTHSRPLVPLNGHRLSVGIMLISALTIQSALVIPNTN